MTTAMIATTVTTTATTGTMATEGSSSFAVPEAAVIQGFGNGPTITAARSTCRDITASG